MTEQGTTTDCPLAGVHEHAFRGPHRFHEWDPADYASPKPPEGPERLLLAVKAAIENIQHNRIGAAIAGLRVARDLTLAASPAPDPGAGLTSLGLDVGMPLDDAFMLGYHNGEADERSRWNNRASPERGLRERLEQLAVSWEGDAEFLEDGDESHNRRRVVLRKRKASPRELAAEAARQCAVQLRAIFAPSAEPPETERR